MSFTYNPFQHIEVTHTPHGNYKLYCHSCGKQWGDFTGAVSAAHLFQDMAEHVKDSHRRTAKDFEGYSTL